MPHVSRRLSNSAPTGPPGRPTRSSLLLPAFRNFGLTVAVPVVRLWFAIRRAVGWRQATGRQRLTITLGAICALSVVTGGALAVAGIGKPGSFAPPQTAATNRALAAAWVVQQVSPAVTVSCDPAMCRQLRENGFPAARLKTLSSARSSLGSGLVVSTPVLRDQFGTSLAAALAPLAIAGFGSGAARVDVRVTAPDGPAAFKSQLAAEHAYLVSAGAQLLGDQNIQVSPAARAVLRTGGADPRLLAMLSVLAAGMPVRLTAFEDPPPEGSAPTSVPLRGAEIGASSPAGISAVLAFLQAQQGVYRPAAVAVVRSSGGQSLVTIRSDAPGPMDGAS
jgi:hypothetical protein